MYSNNLKKQKKQYEKKTIGETPAKKIHVV